MSSARLEVFRHLFSWIAEEMGAVLVRSSRSVNIKERKDCSCAVFDARARMISQAEHIPVHLGSMPLSVRATIDRDWRPGDVVILNDPYRGGTHLPDVTMVQPVFVDGRLEFYVASRAHFSDIGGETPGSMPIATRLEDEGLIIPPTLLTPEFRAHFLANVRNRETAAADLDAMRACLGRGERRLHELVTRYGLPEIRERSEALFEYGDKLTRAAIASLKPGTYRAEDFLDDDGIVERPIKIACTLTIGDTATVDFTGSDPQVAGNVNAVYAVTLSAVLYCFRCLTRDHGGTMEALHVIAPEGSVVNARPPAAVAAGNVETSQRIVDVVLSALAQAAPGRIPASSYGTMNNLAFGGADWGYYETIAGGMGARPDRDGVSAVQMHMTNTLNTPIEALEQIYPVRVTAYTVRRNSGGAGRRRGGDGIVRELEFLDDAHLTVISERRRTGPPGLEGGDAGATGANFLNGRPMPGKFSVKVTKGDRVRIETPGGGGHGLQ